MLSAIFCTVAFSACKPSADSGTDNKPGTDSPKENKNHIFNYTETDKFILENGATEYKIVMPEKITTEIEYARKELVNIFKEATGVTLESTSGGNLTHTQSGK